MPVVLRVGVTGGREGETVSQTPLLEGEAGPDWTVPNCLSSCTSLVLPVSYPVSRYVSLRLLSGISLFLSPSLIR